MKPEGKAVRSSRYHIRVEGMLDQGWTDWLDGFAMLAREDGQTLLTGEVQDSSELHGILSRLHSLGLTLLMVVRVDCPCTSAGCMHRGVCQECLAHESERGAFPACMRKRSKWEKHICHLIVSKTKEKYQ
jgi:hypothetical protein